MFVPRPGAARFALPRRKDLKVDPALAVKRFRQWNNPDFEDRLKHDTHTITSSISDHMELTMRKLGLLMDAINADTLRKSTSLSLPRANAHFQDIPAILKPPVA
jgi:hypothetical protein